MIRYNYGNTETTYAAIMNMDCDCEICVEERAFNKAKKENETMDFQLKQLDYLNSRINGEREDKIEKARKAFYIDWYDYPKTVAEAKERVKKGEFRLDFGDRKDETKISYYVSTDAFTWRTKPADHEGFDEAYGKICEAATKVYDKAMLSYDEGLKALEAFESATFH